MKPKKTRFATCRRLPSLQRPVSLAEIAEEAIEEPDDAPLAPESVEESEIVASEPESEVEIALEIESVVEAPAASAAPNERGTSAVLAAPRRVP